MKKSDTMLKGNRTVSDQQEHRQKSPSIRAARVAPTDWPWAIGAHPAATSESTAWRGALLRSWSGTSSVMEQPPLDHHYVVMHLGGAKRVHRKQEGPATTTIVENGALTIVPAGTEYIWRTEGPIAFAHLYLRPQQLDSVYVESLQCGDGHSLIDQVGCRDPFLEPAFHGMLEEIQSEVESSKLLLDSLLESFCLRLIQKHMARRTMRGPYAESLTPHRLRRVLDFIYEHLSQDIGLSDLVAAAGTSQFHFSRAFRLATGESPYRYLMQRRMEYARILLIARDDSLAQISAKCGFNSERQFAVMFKRQLGVGPKRFRLMHKAGRGGKAHQRLPPGSVR